MHLPYIWYFILLQFAMLGRVFHRHRHYSSHAELLLTREDSRDGVVRKEALHVALTTAGIGLPPAHATSRSEKRYPAPPKPPWPCWEAIGLYHLSRDFGSGGYCIS
jgi:hypothetical protein